MVSVRSFVAEMVVPGPVTAGQVWILLQLLRTIEIELILGAPVDVRHVIMIQ